MSNIGVIARASGTVIACVLFAGATLSSAAAAKERPATTPQDSAQQQQPAAKPAKYCVVDRFTGSRVDRKTCLTRKEWMNRGFDPLMKQ